MASDREKRIEEALRALIDAIDFEGPQGRIEFFPNTPFEWDVLRDARKALAEAA